MSLFTRVNRAIQAFRTAPDLDNIKRTLDKIQKDGDTEIVLAEVSKQRHTKSPSKLAIRDTTTDATTFYAYSYLRSWNTAHKYTVPVYGAADRDEYLGKVWMEEPILAGAVYSM